MSKSANRFVRSLRTESPMVMTLGSAATAKVRLIVWCLDCHRQVEPDPTEQAERHGAELPVQRWRERLVCGRCGSRRVDMVVSGA